MFSADAADDADDADAADAADKLFILRFSAPEIFSERRPCLAVSCPFGKSV